MTKEELDALVALEKAAQDLFGLVWGIDIYEDFDSNHASVLDRLKHIQTTMEECG